MTNQSQRGLTCMERPAGYLGRLIPNRIEIGPHTNVNYTTKHILYDQACMYLCMCIIY